MCGNFAEGKDDEEMQNEEEEEVEDIEKLDKLAVRGGIETDRVGSGVDKRRLKGLGDPRKPTAREVEEHKLTHVPYRNWCSICIRAKGKDLDHRKAVGDDREISEYGFDYCFPGDELGFKLTVLAGREKLTGMNFGIAVPVKGSSGKFAVDKAI